MVKSMQCWLQTIPDEWLNIKFKNHQPCILENNPTIPDEPIHKEPKKSSVENSTEAMNKEPEPDSSENPAELFNNELEEHDTSALEEISGETKNAELELDSPGSMEVPPERINQEQVKLDAQGSTEKDEGQTNLGLEQEPPELMEQYSTGLTDDEEDVTLSDNEVTTDYKVVKEEEKDLEIVLFKTGWS